LNPTCTVMASSLLTAVTWQKSHHSNPSGECVEMAALPGTEIAIRNSRDPDGLALICTKAEVGAFIQGAKNGEFDLLVALCRPVCRADLTRTFATAK
jgi:hypothetical protein